MRFLKIFAISIFIGLNSLSGTPAIDAQEHLHSVTGTVVLSNKIPVKGAIVKLSAGGYADTTDVYGKFTFTSIPAGKYVLSVSRPFMGLEDVRSSISIPLEEQEPLIIVMQRRTYQIDEIVVLSKRDDSDKGVENLPSFVTVVKRSEFENNAVTVADVIMATPSANISVMGGLGDYTEVSLRGAYSNQVQVYIDGMLLNEAIGGAVNLGTIPLTNVESIEVWRSGAPARFGSDAIGGVINIRTLDIRRSQKSFSIGYGSFNTLTANTIVNIPLETSKLNVTVDYASSDNDFEYKSDNGTMYNKEDDYWANRYNDEYHSANLMGKYNKVFENGMLLELSEHILSNKKNLPTKDNARYSLASMETTKNLFQARLVLNPFLKGFFETNPTFYHIYNYERYDDRQGSVGWGKQINTYKTNIYSFMIPLMVKIGKYVSFDFTLSAKQESFNPENKLQQTIPLSSNREHFALAGDAVFTTPGEYLTITSNIRRDRFFSSFEGQPSDINRNTPKSRFNYINNSGIGGKLKVFDSIFIRANYGDISRMPSLFELFGDRGRTLANPDLIPEDIYKWDLGSKFMFKIPGYQLRGFVEYVYFKNNFNNLIQWYFYPAGFIKPQNIGEAYVKGTEIVWNTGFLNRLTCSGSWTFQQSKITKEIRAYYIDKQLPNRPKNFGNVKIEYPFDNISMFWTIDRKSSYYLDQANLDHKLYPGRTLHDLGFTVSLRNDKITLTAIMKNANDVHTFDMLGMPKPGRSFMLTFDFSMN